jgi:putative ABC transport system permease protein
LSNAYFDTKRQQPFEISRDKVDLWVALLIGLIIIVIASFNYLGLVNNNLFCKTKEFSVRRINGGTISDLVSIFMIENILLVVISFLISGYLIALGTPYFNLFTGADITLGYVLQAKQIITLISIVLTLLLLTLAFSWLQIRFDLKKSKIKPLGFKFGRRIQLPVFNVIQLAGAIALTICSIVILKQMSYISQKPIGLNKQVIEVKIPSPFASKASAFKDELEKSPSIESVSIASASPLLEHIIILLNYKENGVEKQYTTAVFLGDEKYSSTLGIQLIEGEGFSGNPQLDKDRCLINETLAKTFPDQNLIGRELPGIERFIVAGVVKDFHYNNLKKIVEPGFISFDTRGHHIMVKPKDNQTQQARNAINEIWSRFITDYPPNTESIGERYEWLHRENNNFIRIIGICCLVSLFLSMIGLFAIAFQISKHRTKEIGIRKVNGAKIWEVMLMLNIDFVKWVAIAFVIATPIAYYAMDKWLQNFAYRTQLSWWVFALAGLLALAIALLTVSWQSWRAARRNPVEALRYE